MFHLESLVDGLLDDPHREMTRNFSNVHLFRESGSPRQIVDADQLDQGLGRPVDHRVRHHACLTESSAERESGEDVPERETIYF